MAGIPLANQSCLSFLQRSGCAILGYKASLVALFHFNFVLDTSGLLWKDSHSEFIFLKAILCCAWPCILTGRTVRAQCSLRTASSCIYLQKKKTTLCVCVCVWHIISLCKSLFIIFFLFSFFFAPNYMKIIIIWFFLGWKIHCSLLPFVIAGAFRN